MLNLKDVLKARDVIPGIAVRTPLLSSRFLSKLCQCNVLLKAENLQRTGSFKVRGATYKISTLSDVEKAKGIIAASAGNHAQGVAVAASAQGIQCTVVMPRQASLSKVQATRGYGAKVILEGTSYDEAQKHAAQLAQEQGLTLIHGFNDEAVIAGQGTLGLELLEQAPDVDIVLVPVGGGGLIAGIALALKESGSRARVIGVQAQAAPACFNSFQAGRLVRIPASFTVADGIAIASPGESCFPLIQRYVDKMVTAAEEDIAHAMLLLLERTKLLVEGAGAISLAALISGKVPCLGKKVALILSGGNVDPNLVGRIIGHGLAEAGRFQLMRVVLWDRPGQLSRLLGCLANAGGNVLEITHRRQEIVLPVGQVEVDILFETRDAAHREEVVACLQDKGYRQLPSEGTGPSDLRTLRFISSDTQP